MRKYMGGIALALALMFGVQGCYGKFNLVRKVYKFNGSFGNKFVNEVMFLVMNIVPVYGIAGFIDAIVVNSIEFWTGKNPVTAQVITQGDKMAKLEYDKASDMVKISYFVKGELKSENYMRRSGDDVELLASDAKTVTLVAKAGALGTTSLASASGVVLAESVR